jgi:hypothetical protein
VTAGILKGLGYVVDEVAGAMKAIYALADDAVAGILNSIGFAADLIVQALQDVFNDTADEIDAIAQTIGGAFADAVDAALCALSFGIFC